MTSEAKAELRSTLAATTTALNDVLAREGLKVVTFEWATGWGPCADCGLPAAYVLPDRYGPNQVLDSDHLACCRCAALAIAEEGGRIVFLNAEDDNDDPTYKMGTPLSELNIPLGVSPATMWTLTVQEPHLSQAHVSVHAGEVSAMTALRDNFFDGEDVADGDAALTSFADRAGLVFDAEEHDLPTS